MNIINEILSILEKLSVPGLLGVIIGKYLDEIVKPHFKYIEITGNKIEVEGKSFLQCSVKYRVKFRPFGSRALAKNSRGWVKLDEIHSAIAPWGYNYYYSLDIVGEESLVVLFICPIPKSIDDVQKVYFTVPSDSNRWDPRNLLGNVIKVVNFDKKVKDKNLEVRVASENANGDSRSWKLEDFVKECIKYYKSHSDT